MLVRSVLAHDVLSPYHGWLSTRLYSTQQACGQPFFRLGRMNRRRAKDGQKKRMDVMIDTGRCDAASGRVESSVVALTMRTNGRQ